MAHVNIDFTLPIALLCAGLVGVFTVSQVVRLASRWSRSRTEKLIETTEPSDPASSGGAHA